MPVRAAATAVIFTTAALLVGGGIILAQDASSLPAESPVASSPTAIESPPASMGVEPSASTSAATLSVTLQDGVVTPAMTSIPAGSVTFDVSNTGGLIHEFVVIRTDIAAADLPTLEDGSFDEDAEGVEVLGEIEDIAPGSTQSLTLDLTAGHHVILCNIVGETDGQPFSHFAAGMRADLDVTDAGASMAPGSLAASPMASMAAMPMATADAAASPAS